MVKYVKSRNFKRSGVVRKTIGRNRTRSRAFPMYRGLQSGETVMPNKTFTKLRWSLNLSGAYTNSKQIANIEVNNMFDPNYFLGGDQPTGYDQMSAFYTAYRVHAVSIDSYIENSATGTMVDVGYQITPYEQSTSNFYVRDQVQRSRNGTVKNLSNWAPNFAWKFKRYISCAKILGLTKTAFNASDDTMALTALAPNKKCVFTIMSWRHDDPTNIAIANTLNGTVNVTFYVEFLRRNMLPLS